MVISPNVKVVKYKTKHEKSNSKVNPISLNQVAQSKEYSTNPSKQEVQEALMPKPLIDSQDVIITDAHKYEQQEINDAMLSELRRDVIYK